MVKYRNCKLIGWLKKTAHVVIYLPLFLLVSCSGNLGEFLLSDEFAGYLALFGIALGISYFIWAWRDVVDTFSSLKKESRKPKKS